MDICRISIGHWFTIFFCEKKKQNKLILLVFICLRPGAKNLYLWFSHFSGETKNWITFARSVLYCWKSDRILLSNIQIHCYWCFELTIKILLSLWRVSLEFHHFDHFFLWKSILLQHFKHLSHGKTSYLGKMSTNIMDFFMHTIFWSMIDAFMGVLIGQELREFDRMCAMWLVFPRWQKGVLVKIRVMRFWLPTDDVLFLCQIQVNNSLLLTKVLTSLRIKTVVRRSVPDNIDLWCNVRTRL